VAPKSQAAVLDLISATFYSAWRATSVSRGLSHEAAALVAPAEAPESSVSTPVDCRPGRCDAVTLVLAEVTKASEPPPAPPGARLSLAIVRDAVADLYTNARDWLVRECPIDYGS
jgi:hypothetical protein